jgi:hypothetical protein
MTEFFLKNKISKQKSDSIVYFLNMMNIDAEVKKQHKKRG